MKKSVLAASLLLAAAFVFTGCNDEEKTTKKDDGEVLSKEYWNNLADTLSREEFYEVHRKTCGKLKNHNKIKYPESLKESCANASEAVSKVATRSIKEREAEMEAKAKK